MKKSIKAMSIVFAGIAVMLVDAIFVSSFIVSCVKIFYGRPLNEQEGKYFEYPAEYTLEYCMKNYAVFDLNLHFKNIYANSVGKFSNTSYKHDDKHSLSFKGIDGVPTEDFLVLTEHLTVIFGGVNGRHIVRHKASAVDPIKDFTVSKITLTGNQINDENLQNEILKAIREGERTEVDQRRVHHTERKYHYLRYPSAEGANTTPIELSLQIEFEEYENIYWSAPISKDENGKYYFSIFNVYEYGENELPKYENNAHIWVIEVPAELAEMIENIDGISVIY